MINRLLRIFNPRWHLLKNEVARQHAGPYTERNSAGYTIAIISRGEQLFYADENGALVLEISIPGQWVDAASIRKWDEVGDVSDEQRSLIIERIKQYFITYQGICMKLINDNGQLGVVN